MQLPDTSIEKEVIANGYRWIIGVDEAGRGPLCGSVVAAAVTRKDWNATIDETELKLLRDSKSLSSKQREAAHEIVMKHFFVGVGECDNQTIDRVNILQATFLAMKKSITQLRRMIQSECRIEMKVSDENIFLLLDGRDGLNVSLSQQSIIGGDKTVQSIAVASIVAKVTRDREIIHLHEQYPCYGFDRNKGYGTKEHMDALQKYGPSPIHRFSFRPVAEAVTHRAINRELG